jgi:hypothetical protein
MIVSSLLNKHENEIPPQHNKFSKEIFEYTDL